MMPEGWQRRRLGDFAARSKVINTAGDLLPPLSITKGRGVILQSDKYKKQIATDLKKYVIARRGQFAFDPMSLYYGAIGQVAPIEEGLVSPDYVVFDVDATIDSLFLNVLLRWPEQIPAYEAVAETGNQFGKRRRVYWSVFSELVLALPPIGEQRKIAAILSSVDDAIEATQAVIDQLHVVKKAMMAELLTRGLPGRHTRFKRAEIGEVPEAWDVVPLGALLADIHAGWSPQCDSNPAGENEWGVLKVSAVSWDEFRASENKRMPAVLEYRPEIEVKVGDLLVSRANTPGLVGRSVYVSSTRPLLMLSDKIMRLVPDRERADPRFINFVLGATASRDQIENAATGSSRSMKNLSQEKLRGVLVVAPPLDEQTQIMSLVDATSAHIVSQREFLAGMQTLKSALMAVLLTGEVRVAPAQVA